VCEKTFAETRNGRVNQALFCLSEQTESLVVKSCESLLQNDCDFGIPCELHVELPVFPSLVTSLLLMPEGWGFLS